MLLVGIALAAPRGLGAEECRSWTTGEQVATIPDEIDESSGIAASHRTAGLLWTHNDSGGEARLFGIDTDGRTAATIELGGVDARDWEDIARGPCGADDGHTCLHVGDIGDNLTGQDSVVLHLFREPNIPEKMLERAPAAKPPKILVEQIGSIRYRYPGGPRNAESLLVHPKTAEIYVIDKIDEGSSHVWRIPRRDEDDGETVEAIDVGTIELAESGFMSNKVTAADFSPDGTELSFRTYTNVYTMCDPSGDVEAMLSGERSRSVPLSTVQGEALAYGANGDVLWLTSERLPAPLIRLEPDELETTSRTRDVPAWAPATRDHVREQADPRRVREAREPRAGCRCSAIPGVLIVLPLLRRRSPS